MIDGGDLGSSSSGGGSWNNIMNGIIVDLMMMEKQQVFNFVDDNNNTHDTPPPVCLSDETCNLGTRKCSIHTYSLKIERILPNFQYLILAFQEDLSFSVQDFPVVQ